MAGASCTGHSCETLNGFTSALRYLVQLTAVPAVPDAEQLVAPDAEQAVVPDAEQAVVPDAEQPVAPGAEQPVVPGAEQLVVPGAVPPVVPDAEQPVAPHAEQPVVPGAVPPVAPGAVPPVVPDAEQLVEPDVEQPAVPGAEQLVAPHAEPEPRSAERPPLELHAPCRPPVTALPSPDVRRSRSRTAPGSGSPPSGAVPGSRSGPYVVRARPQAQAPTRARVRRHCRR